MAMWPGEATNCLLIWESSSIRSEANIDVQPGRNSRQWPDQETVTPIAEVGALEGGLPVAPATFRMLFRYGEGEYMEVVV
ncbi:hypothetical protein Sar04_24950 [Salinispora arenicola]|uniref:Uncharacterized protein n=1 Tax=Salinispora arenicola TaxID=168697 RepID=A0ABQ4JS19_SALAC|nr:hypothetical protein Sar04_24950 [Salinispora arenicola]